MNRIERACLLALILPIAIVTTAAAWVTVGERAGGAPFGGHRPANIAEAAAVGSAGDVVRLLRAGEDPRKLYSVEPEIISSAILRVTGLEAAMWSRQVELIELLDREGAIPPANRPALACLAADLELDDIVEYLARHEALRCEAGKAMEQVLARTRERREP